MVGTEPAQMLPQLIVGLGNPGAKYDRTRHNIGFEIIDALAKSYPGVSLSENKRFQGLTGEFRSGTERTVLLKPTTFMNNSGQSVRAVLDWYKLAPASVLVLYDDMDLPVGKLRLRLSGGAGGHNGMKSMIAHLGTQDFPRLRVGIGSTDKAAEGDSPMGRLHQRAVVSHVLGRFSPEDRKIVDAVIPMAVDAIDLSLRKGVERAMNLYNGRAVEV